MEQSSDTTEAEKQIASDLRSRAAYVALLDGNGDVLFREPVELTAATETVTLGVRPHVSDL